MELFPDSVLYDEPLHVGDRKKVNTCNVAFVCVPTPNPDKGMLDTSIVAEVLDWCDCDLIVVRSTVNPGFCDEWSEKTGKRIVFEPEYLGETPGHPMLDPRTRPFKIIGGARRDREQLIELYAEVYNADISLRLVSNYEAEVIKLTENRAIMFKVMQCQELYDACKAHGVDYYVVRDAVYGDDPRFNLWWTFIYPNKRGANSKCIPKDPYAWAAWAESCPLTEALLEYNEELLDAQRRHTE